jgi:hypothetical protein
MDNHTSIVVLDFAFTPSNRSVIAIDKLAKGNMDLSNDLYDARI